MEPVTHLLTGAVLSRACGFNKRTLYATATMVLAAELPDIDIVYDVQGPVHYFQHFRGWTHSFLGLPLEALLLLTLVFLWSRLRPHQPRAGDPLLRWGILFCGSLLALTSHVLLDWTNSYGVRPFAPFNPRWYQGEFVFLFEPLILAALVLALILPPLFALTDGEVGARKQRFRGQGSAIAALLFILALWGYRFTQHEKAVAIAQQQLYPQDASIVSIRMNPYAATPYEWHAVVETPAYYQTGTINTRLGTMDFTPQEIYFKGAVTPATQIAEASPLGRVYMDWSRAPLVDDLGLLANQQDVTLNGLHAVRFRDLRFLYNTFAFQGQEKAPLSGTVYLDAQNKIVRTEMNGTRQR